MIEARDCSALAVEGLNVQKCDSLALTLGQHAVMEGAPEIQVTNPAPAGCSDTRADLLTVVKGPAIASVAPALVCTDDASKPLVINGTGFLKVGTQLPSVKVSGVAVQSVDSASGCSSFAVHGLTAETCTTLNVTVAQHALMSGRPTVAVTNPDPAGCSASRADVLTVPPLLTVTSLTPLNVCQGTNSAALPVTLMGTGLLRVGAASTSLTFAGAAVTPTTLTDCSPLTVAGASDVSSCNTLQASLNVTGKTAIPGALPIVLSNGEVPACALSATTSLHVVAPPAVSAIDIVSSNTDDAVCSGKGFTVTVTGTGFVPGTSVVFRNSNAKSVSADSVSVTSATALTATFNSGLAFDATDPSYDLIVSTADNCSGPPLANVLRVDPTPLVFFVDPPIAYNAISIDATVFTSGLSGLSPLDKIELAGPGSATTTRMLTVVSNPKPNRIVARIPGIDSGTGQPTLSPGNYSVRVTSQLGCTGELAGGLKVTATTDAAVLTSVAPSFVSPNSATAVTIDGAGLMSVPRLYLSPATGSGTAQALRAVELQAATRLSAVVPSGLGAGNYNLILVNPDGKVGVLASGVTVTAGSPPVIDSVVPASLVPNASTLVTISGRGFDVATTQLECKASATATTTTIVNGTLSPSPTANQVKATFNPGTNGVAAGSICLLKLTNQDGAFYEYSALSTTNSSLNLSPWGAGTALTTGRRALSLVAGRPTGTSRFLYAIGGDSGVSGANNQASIGTTVFGNVEAANVDVFGNMGSWALQTRTPLPAPRTWAGAASIGRFIYLVGGHNGTTATNTLYRAQILDPLATPEIEDLDATLSDGTSGLAAGLYYYAVAAIFPSNDPSNPGGESLKGELLPVELPARPEKILLSLSWRPIAGAHGYRIYRSPTPNAALSSLALLAEKTCGAATGTCDCVATPSQCHLDDNGSTTPSGNAPLAAGALGAWHAVDGARCTAGDCLLGTAREALATVAVRNPNDATKYFLYAFGGRDASGTYLNTYEVATVTVASNGTQTVADWAPGGQTLASPRAELGAWVVHQDNSSIIRGSGSPNAVWIYLGGGRTTAGAADTGIAAGTLQASGDLNAFVTANVTALKTALTGFGAGASNDRLYTFGGNGTSADGTSASLCSGAGGGCAGAIPDLPNNAWNALGNASTSRIYMGAAQESAFFFLAGGWFSGATLTSSERTLQ